MMRQFKLGIVLAVVAVVLSLGWSYLPHLLFASLLASVAIIVLASAATYDSWRQMGRIGQAGRLPGTEPQPR